MAPSTQWKEVVPEGESALHETLAAQLAELQRARPAPVSRGLHAKGQIGLEARLDVLPDLPAHARVGIFAEPRSYRAFVRVSNGSGDRASDRKPDVRGLAVKVLGVPGRKLIPGLEAATTQDFLLIRTPTMPFRNASDFVWFVRAMRNPAALLPKVIWRFGLGGFGLLRQLAQGLSVPFGSVATTTYFSVLPTAFGAHAVRWTLHPVAREADPKPGEGSEFVAEDLGARLRRGALAWDLRVQFYEDEGATPIEDPTRDWTAPWLTVARLTIPEQDTSSARGERLSAFIEQLSFDPWHAPVEFRPLGEMMRARSAAYRVSTQVRGAAPEPTGEESFE